MKNNESGRIARSPEPARAFGGNARAQRRRGGRILTVGVFCAAWIALSHSPLAHAQANDPLAEQAQRQAVRDQEQRLRAQEQAVERERSLNAPKVELQAPAAVEVDDGKLPVETTCFKVDTLMLEVPSGLSETVQAAGARALSPNPLFPGELTFANDYLQRYRGQCIGREGLNVIVHRVMVRIIERGYSTTRVVIAPQDLSSGTLKLQLIPGVISAIRFADPSTYGTWRNAFPTKAGDLLDLRRLEQGLEQMKRVPNQDVDMQIVPGPSAGESDVVIAVKRTKPWSLAISADDSGLKSTGQLQGNVSVTLDNPLGLSDLFNISYSHDINGHTNEYGTYGSSAYYTIPWGNWTLTATASRYNYHQEIAGAYGSYVSSGNSSTYDVKTEYQFFRNQVQKNTLEFRFGKRFSDAFLDGSKIDVQHRDSTYAELGWEHKHYFGAAQLDSTLAYRWGVPWFGASQDLPSVNSTAPTNYYHMETLDATLSVPFAIAGFPLRYVATVRAQNSPNTLYATEYFSIGSRYTVRGFDGNTMLAAEKGVFMRNDLEIPLGRLGQALYLGLDGGEVFGPGAEMLLGRRLAGAVVGLRGGAFKHVSYDVFIGGPLYQPARFPNRWPVAGFSVSFLL
ncbi:ShlB/FhaC/HecB family hemolysin secretion/activation protein [Paraburkholderia sp. D15]|uniref:ShlB/FhaC/HecB family hemolysin secretion/activation protein n=1 Tax=Paraburkholderia sp. D15 TaxID=2880218 RepID=UPI00247938B7|nr:ShlB/FhaC/HecB family hemolysin secretion/activation protein [Paraburkholderia sp. D15]WGS49987.1 ShlB/FhaC/HecB family hemolysin secretion/activation protein [Paraburkholderia sp. D15]